MTGWIDDRPVLDGLPLVDAHHDVDGVADPVVPDERALIEAEARRAGVVPDPTGGWMHSNGDPAAWPSLLNDGRWCSSAGFRARCFRHESELAALRALPTAVSR